MAEQKTEIKLISDDELNAALGLGGAENIISVQESSKNPLNKQKDKTEEALNLSKEKEKEEEKEEVVTKTQEEIEAALKLSEENISENEDSSQDTNDKKSPILSAVQQLIKDEALYLFEPEEGKDEKSIEEYTTKEWIALINANQNRIRTEEQEKAPVEFFDSLPAKMQYAANYVMNGGTNLESLFLALAQSIQTENLDIKTPEGQEQVVRRWGAITELTPEEIEEELVSLKDMPGALEKKANVYKPKLDAKQQQIVEKQIKDAETRRKNEEAAVVRYKENIINALRPADLNGQKITPTVQAMIYNGLTNFDKKGRNGQPTNELGLLLEEYNFVKPNPVLMSKVYWLLKDEKAYEESVRASGNKEIVKETVLKLKTEAGAKATATNLDQTKKSDSVRKTMQKPKQSIFTRTT